MKGRDIVVIVKPTESCNLACKYCYRPTNIDNLHMMSEATVENIFSRFLSYNNSKLEVIWHGGEPLLAGKKFFQRVVEIGKKMNNTKHLAIKNSIQTNGILLDKDFISFFKENDFSIGVSFDGPKDIHNSNRVYLNGSGTYNAVNKALCLLVESNFQNFGVLITLTKNSLGFEKEIYYSIKDIGVKNAKIGYYIPAGAGELYRHSLHITSSEYAASINKFYDMWISDADDIKLSPLVEIVESMFIGKNSLCDYSGACTNFLSIEPNGDVYPCGRFSGVSQFKMGNINEDDINSIIKSHTYRKMLERNSSLSKECQSCKFMEVCMGGCSFESYVYFGDLYHKTPYCNGRKAIFNHIYSDLQNRIK